MNKILEQLKKEALYAQRSFSTELLYQTYGKAQMARKLEALTQSEFMEINEMTVYYMNTNRDTFSIKTKNFLILQGWQLYCEARHRTGRNTGRKIIKIKAL